MIWRVRKLRRKRRYMPLLLVGDESPQLIERYLERSDLFVLWSRGRVRAVCAVSDRGDGTGEIENLAVEAGSRRRGYGRRMIDRVARHYRGRYERLVLGTGEVPGTLRFYARCGFTVTHRTKNYFTEHYDHPIVEEGVVLCDRIMLSLDLDKYGKR